MNGNGNYIEASKMAKIIAAICVLTYILAVSIALKGGAGDVWHFTENADRDWVYVSLRVTWGLMWVGAIYLMYLALISVRQGIFPASTAIVPIRTRQVSGTAAYVVCLLALVAAVTLAGMPLMWKSQLDGANLIMQKLHAPTILKSNGSGASEGR